MSISAKAIRETVGFLGVIGSLVFVGLEIQQNTLAAQATAIQESTNVARQQVQMYALDPEANRIAMLGNEDVTQLNSEELSRYRWMTVSFFWGMQGQYRQWDLGVLPDAEWRAWNTVICNNMAVPGIRLVWEELDFFTPEFTRVVESCETFRTS